MTIRNFFLEKLCMPLIDLAQGTHYVKYLDEAREIQHWNEKQLLAHSHEKLGRILQYASEHSPYYRSLNATKNSDPVAWLRNFPILTKARLRKHNESLLTVDKSKLIKSVTRGSRGYQSTAYFSPA